METAWLHSHLLMPTGGTKFIYEITRRIASFAGITLYCERARDDIRQMFEQGGVRVETIGAATSTSVFYWLRLRRHLESELKVLRNKIKPGTAIVSSMFPMNVLANALTDNAVQYCFEPFAFFFSQAMISGLPLPRRLFCRFLARRYGRLDIENTRKAKNLITLNRTTQRQISRIYGADSGISLAGINADFFYPQYDSELASRYAGQKIIMHSTDYSPVKASNLVIQAMPAILHAVPNARLLISNTYDNKRGRARLLALAHSLGVDERVTFLGYLEFSDVPKYYTLADVVIQPAFAEDAGTASMNLAVKEAMACQTPVVRADITDEDAEHEVSGMLVPPNDPLAIAEAAIKILSDGDWAAKMGIVGRRRITKLYNWDRTTDVIYQKILETNGQKGTDG